MNPMNTNLKKKIYQRLMCIQNQCIVVWLRSCCVMLLCFSGIGVQAQNIPEEMLSEVRSQFEAALDGDLPEGASDEDMAEFNEIVEALKRGENPSSDMIPSQIIDLLREVLRERGELSGGQETTAEAVVAAPADDQPVADSPVVVPDAKETPVGPSEGDLTSDEQRMVAMSFRNMEMEKIGQFLMKELKKPVIVHDEIKSQRVTIIAQDKLPLYEALDVLGEAMRQKGVFVLESPRQIQLLPLVQIRNIPRLVVPADQSVAELPMQSAIVDKVFEIKHYDVEKIKDVIQPLLPDYAMILADPNTRRVIVTDAAANLVRIELIIAGLDVDSANQALQRVFEIEHGDASEIVSMVRIIIAGSFGGEAREVLTSSGGSSRSPSRSRNSRNSRSSQSSNVVFVEPNQGPIMLHADLARNWIIAAASPEVMPEIERWIKELDQPKAADDEPFELLEIQHADMDEVADKLEDAIRSIPDDDIRNNTRVIPFEKSRQLLVYGSTRGRKMVASMLEQLDVESSRYEVIKQIQLVHDTAANIKQKIEDLFSNKSNQQQSRFYYYGARNQQSDEDVKVTVDSQRNSVTIVAPPNKMEEIERLIREEWDVQIQLDDVKPKIYELQYVDPVQVEQLLTDMYTRSQSRSQFDWVSGTTTTESSNPVGRLFGQFSFAALEDTNKLIVSSTSSNNYSVIDDIIAELDQPRDAGLPFVIELKHANAEDLAEQLNAIFSESGAPAAVRRTERGLSDAIRGGGRGNDNTNNNRNNGNNNNNGNQNNQNNGNTIQFWWSQSRARADEQPVSTLIGKPRFVPVNRRNALMVLAPDAYEAPLIKMIEELDRPGSQVVINAVIAEVIHDDESSLGVRFASDPGLFTGDSSLSDQSIGGGVNFAWQDTFDSGRGTIDVGVDINFLLQLLMQEVNLKILNEPKVYTSDNQEAHFFDGQDVPVVTGDRTSGNTDAITREFDYEEVGTRLHVRPHITQEGDIDLEVNLELSRIENSETVFGNFIFNRRETTTHVTLQDGQTVVISGIIRKEDFEDVRKLPLLGDLPLLGGLFRNTNRGIRNREIVAFITPTIVNYASKEADALSQENEEWLEALRSARAEDVEERAKAQQEKDKAKIEAIKEEQAAEEAALIEEADTP